MQLNTNEDNSSLIQVDDHLQMEGHPNCFGIGSYHNECAAVNNLSTTIAFGFACNLAKIVTIAA